jgi:hypothetical protein
MARPDPSFPQSQQSTTSAFARLWAAVAMASFRSPPQPRDSELSIGPDTRRVGVGWSALRGVCLFLAFMGVMLAAALVMQARSQSRIERGVRGSYVIESCGQTHSARTGPTGWACHGTFRPASGSGSRSARLTTSQSQPPQGQVTVMAASPTRGAVWLPDDVSSQKRWRWAMLSVVLISVPSLATFFVSRRRAHR